MDFDGGRSAPMRKLGYILVILAGLVSALNAYAGQAQSPGELHPAQGAIVEAAAVAKSTQAAQNAKRPCEKVVAAPVNDRCRCMGQLGPVLLRTRGDVDPHATVRRAPAAVVHSISTNPDEWIGRRLNQPESVTANRRAAFWKIFAYAGRLQT